MGGPQRLIWSNDERRRRLPVADRDRRRLITYGHSIRETMTRWRRGAGVARNHSGAKTFAVSLRGVPRSPMAFIYIYARLYARRDWVVGSRNTVSSDREEYQYAEK